MTERADGRGAARGVSTKADVALVQTDLRAPDGGGNDAAVI